MLDETGLLAYATIIDDLGSLTYGDLTNDGTEAKVIIISKFADSNNEVLFYDDSIRSNWANSDDFDYIYEYLTSDANTVSSENINDRFCVMQAVATMQMNGPGIIKAMGSWSLINRAKTFNEYLVTQDDFTALLTDLPIVMVDYSDTAANDFNSQIMEMIMDFNRNL